MSDSDDCAPILVKGKNEDGRNSYTKYEPNGVKVRDTARKSTGGATPRKVIVSKRPVAVVVTGKPGPKRAKLNKNGDGSESEEDDESNSDGEVVAKAPLKMTSARITKTADAEDDSDEEEDISEDDDVDSESDEDAVVDAKKAADDSE